MQLLTLTRILQPEGVVEFLEIDPRPRIAVINRRRSSSNGHTSGPETNWTDKIADRFKDPYDEQLATNVPKWTQRVEERLKASLRPKDGVPAANLKSWLEGAGFWDVKQVVLRLPVGGSSAGGKLLLQFLKQQVELENQVPVVKFAFLIASKLLMSPRPDQYATLTTLLLRDVLILYS